jgi:geranylgeranyl diphosphate synthase type I
MTDESFFTETLGRQKQQFDRVIEEYWRQALPAVQRHYGDASEHALQALADFMSRGGKRLRASMAEQAYRMFGGDDQAVIDQVGLALELIHAYLLITDDISDQSDTRRGGPTVHRILGAWHDDTHLQGNGERFGADIAILAAMTGMHMAMDMVSTLPVSAERRVAALENLNRLLVATCHGQINDIYNQASATHDPQAAERVLLQKTAYYSFVNPLQLGAILAGASAEALQALEQYGIAASRTFQISDDVIGLFGDSQQTGKSTMDDLREGKRTLLVLKALELAGTDDGTFLESQLGNQNLTQEDFTRCQHIVRDCGALDFVTAEMARSAEEAVNLLQASTLPDGDSLRFLRGLTGYLQARKN